MLPSSLSALVFNDGAHDDKLIGLRRRRGHMFLIYCGNEL